ncbi:MAG: flagellar basal body L-ring protein FlgH [Phycisphaerales bacterium]|nr:flagellar basal body L-ring protein FlgH [Phycisphaerales bacterium]
MRTTLVIGVLLFGPGTWVFGQSSSLFKADRAKEVAAAALTTQPAANGALPVNAGTTKQPSSTRNVALAKFSLTAVSPPEPAVIKVHDLIGVIVRHRYRARTDSRMEQESEWDIQARLDAWFRIHDRRWLQQDFGGGTPEISFNNQNELENQGRADRRDLLETRMMGKVIDVKPNGNLIIVASYSIGTDHDEQILALSGEISTRDIGPDRTVTSEKIFGLEIVTTPRGAIADATKRGWFKEALDLVKPF